MISTGIVEELHGKMICCPVQPCLLPLASCSILPKVVVNVEVGIGYGNSKTKCILVIGISN